MYAKQQAPKLSIVISAGMSQGVELFSNFSSSVIRDETNYGTAAVANSVSEWGRAPRKDSCSES